MVTVSSGFCIKYIGHLIFQLHYGIFDTYGWDDGLPFQLMHNTTGTIMGIM